MGYCIIATILSVLLLRRSGKRGKPIFTGNNRVAAANPTAYLAERLDKLLNQKRQ